MDRAHAEVDLLGNLADGVTGPLQPLDPGSRLAVQDRRPPELGSGDIVRGCGLSGLRQLLQQRLRVLQVLRVEAFSEPFVDRGQE